MKILARLALAGLLALGVLPAHADVVVNNDGGGVIVDYIRKYSDIRRSGEKLVVSGYCASACTLFLGILPTYQYCFAEGARLGFHSASFKFPDGRYEHATEFSALMFNIYPPHVRRIIKMLGWNGDRPEIPHPEMVWASGKVLRAMGPYCAEGLT